MVRASTQGFWENTSQPMLDKSLRSKEEKEEEMEKLENIDEMGALKLK